MYRYVRLLGGVAAALVVAAFVADIGPLW